MSLLTTLLFLPLISAFTPAPALPPFPASAETPFCNRTSTLTYTYTYGPLFVEHSFVCNFEASPASSASSSELALDLEPLSIPAPFSHPGGQRGSDPDIISLGRIESEAESYQRMIQESITPKTQIPHYGCDLFTPSHRLPIDKWSNLFWGLRSLTNVTCINPGEVREYTDIQRDWTADWRLVVSNRGKDRECFWWTELANIGEALHYVCYFSELGTGLRDQTGGREAVAWGRRDDLRFCVRYSEKGWGQDIWRERCLGTGEEEEGKIDSGVLDQEL
ncbi:Similar to hypothetical protein [Tuber melanosporum Mel28]; acc. no. XP_002835822 [Pyronema omphalodes CBS 100304]|uniref:Uncharacterized protein n=1 Tax=Pyronema omphalodes (strain CBS 100304) TaxID=1076935 RepID=U4LIX2_PYROM|nr:Similar to hypothetical protein [Tuber melanosporum Mel28]; acc. no. XP_002835822 [Pyronema omphalodes CBS 100304]